MSNDHNDQSAPFYGDYPVDFSRLEELKVWLERQLRKSMEAFYRAGGRPGVHEEEIENITKKIDTYQDLIFVVEEAMSEIVKGGRR